jgi:hypothetical protein
MTISHSSQSIILPRLMVRDGMIARVTAMLQGLPMDRAWRISVAENKPSRSQQQNKYLWGVIYKTILDAGQLQGWDADDLHEYLLGEWSGWEVIEGFGRKRMKPIQRSSTLTKEQFSAYVDFIQRKMAELGIYVPDANRELAA